MLIDSHCHLDYYTPERLEEVIDNIKSSKMEAVLTISTKFEEFGKIINIANRESFIYASIGTHPENAKVGSIKAQDILNLCQSYSGKVIGIGETGLDYFHAGYEKKAQIECFTEHIIASQESSLPIIIHSRDADIDMLDILRKYKAKKDFKILMHCFTGGEEFAKQLLELGAFISFSGIVTFKNAIDIVASMLTTPSNRILIETDAPFLAPVPFRGKQNEPMLLKHTASFIAEKRGESYENFVKTTSENFKTLFFR